MFYKRSPWYTHLHGADTSLQLQFLAQKGGMMGRHSKFDRDEPSWYLSESDNGFERTWRSKALDLVVLIGFQSFSHLLTNQPPSRLYHSRHPNFSCCPGTAAGDPCLSAAPALVTFLGVDWVRTWTFQRSPVLFLDGYTQDPLLEIKYIFYIHIIYTDCIYMIHIHVTCTYDVYKLYTHSLYIHIIYTYYIYILYIHIKYCKSSLLAIVSSPQQKCKNRSNVMVYGMVYICSYPRTSI